VFDVLTKLVHSTPLWIFSTNFGTSSKGNSDTARVVNHKIKDILERYERATAKAYFNKSDIFDTLKAEFKPKPETKVLSPIEYIDRFIERKASELTLSSIKTYRSSLRKLTQFVAEKKITLTWDSFSTVFFDEFKVFLTQKFKLNNNSNKKILDTIKTLLTNAKSEGFNPNPEYEKYSTKRLKTKTDEIALTLDELKALKAFTSDNLRLQRVRDMFLFMCLTGLRVSDLRNVTREKIKDDVLTIRAQKDKDLVSIPLVTDALTLLERYNYNMHTYSYQKLNQYIKEVCQLVGGSFLQDENVSTVRGTEIITETVKRYERVTNHTARRTFVTIAYELGIDLDTVSKLVGHSDKAITSLYNKVRQSHIIQKAKAGLEGFEL
jgi:integrase